MFRYASLVGHYADSVRFARLSSSATTLHEVPRPLQVCNLRAPAESLALLQGFAAVSLANNHVQDYGGTGCRNTLAALGRTGIAHFGLGDYPICAPVSGKPRPLHGKTCASAKSIRLWSPAVGLTS
ncbi:CapA family protein [Nitrosovibrio sp. Nv4]|uniref:CapA family protein n=1 Tax=Nitrosovibrio sp. Nv4 TaxID=1945880 RepID=UPI000BE4424C